LRLLKHRPEKSHPQEVCARANDGRRFRGGEKSNRKADHELLAPVTAEAERVSNDQWRVRMSAPVAGRWSLGLGITISASDTVNVVSPILIR
jgi:hypothetical protein